MVSSVATGYSQLLNSFDAGREIAESMQSDLVLSGQTLLLLFATPHHNVNNLIAGVKSVIGEDIDVLGCTTTGLICNDFISYTGALSGGLIISSDPPGFHFFSEENINDREFDAGKKLAEKIKNANLPDEHGLLFFYDSIKTTSTEGTPELNLATPILQGFKEGYGYWPKIAGIGAWGDIQVVHPCQVWIENKIQRNLIGALSVSGRLKMDTVIMHGTKPMSDYHTITRAAKNVIYEIDGTPALAFIDKLMGGSVPWEEFPLLVTLGVNTGDKYGDYQEELYASRLCFGIDQENKALIMFETDLETGSEIQLMQRNIDFKYIGLQVEKLFEKVGSAKPLAALYIDCLGRVSGFSGLQQEESLEVYQQLKGLPFFGIFSGVEIANVGKEVKALDWTGVLCIISENTTHE